VRCPERCFRRRARGNTRGCQARRGSRASRKRKKRSSTCSGRRSGEGKPKQERSWIGEPARAASRRRFRPAMGRGEIRRRDVACYDSKVGIAGPGRKRWAAMLIESAEPDPQYLPPSACFGARRAEKAAGSEAIPKRASRPATATGCKRFRREHSAEARFGRDVACYVSDEAAQGTRSPGGERSSPGNAKRVWGRSSRSTLIA